MPRIDLHSTRPGYDHQQCSSINFKASTCQKLIWFCVKNTLTQWSETLGWTDLDLIFFAGKFFKLSNFNNFEAFHFPYM